MAFFFECAGSPRLLGGISAVVRNVSLLRFGQNACRVLFALLAIIRISVKLIILYILLLLFKVHRKDYKVYKNIRINSILIGFQFDTT